jgi:hypothetical protein
VLDGAKCSDVAGELASPPVEGQMRYCTPPKDANNRKKRLSHLCKECTHLFTALAQVKSH